MKSGFFLDVVVRKGSSIFKLLSSEDKSLLIWWNSFFVLDFGLDVFNGVSWLNIKSDGFSSKSLDEDLHTSSKSENQVESWLFLNVVVWKSSSIFKLLSSENESLLIWWDSFFILDFSFNIFNGVCWFNIKSDGFSSKSFDEDLHTSSKSENQMKSWFFLNVIVGEGSSVFKLLSSEDESLLIWWDSFFILDFSLDIFNGVCWLNIESNGLSSKSLNKDLHTSSKSKDQVKSWFFLDVVIWKSSSIFKLLSSKDKSLLIWWDSFFVLDLSLDIFNGICWLNIKSDSFTCEGFDENLHVLLF